MTTPTASGANSAFSAADLTARAIQRRAVDAVIWGIPAVNFNLMFQFVCARRQRRPQPDRLIPPAAEGSIDKRLTWLTADL